MTVVGEGPENDIVVVCVEIDSGTTDGGPFDVHTPEREREFFERETEIGVGVVEFCA